MLAKTRFLDLECIQLANQSLSLLITQSVGPRILSLRLRDGPNLFAELPDTKLVCPGYGVLTFWGGHRLWHAPESRQRTYQPDYRPLSVQELADGIQVIQPLEAPTGIQKTLQVHLPTAEPTVIVDHLLTNAGLWPIELAPWAITQFKPGGVAILPQPIGNSDPDGLTPNRQLALWPYTDIRSPYITWGNDFILVSATMERPAIKLGFPNPAGWLAYHWRDALFVKKAPFNPQATYTDRGSSSECYCNDQFLELETLGPRTILAPGETAHHREVWQLFGQVTFEPGLAAARALADELDLFVPSPYLEEQLNYAN